MTIPHDHSDVLDRIWTQFQNSVTVRGSIDKLLVQPANTAEQLLALATRHNIVDATGLELDDIGAMLDISRDQLGGLNDSDYRSALIIRGRSILAGGSLDDFTSFLGAILPCFPTAIPVIEWFPAAVRV